MNILLLLILLIIGIINILYGKTNKFYNLLKIILLIGVSIFMDIKYRFNYDLLTSSPLYIQILEKIYPELIVILILVIMYIVYKMNSLNKNEQD